MHQYLHAISMHVSVSAYVRARLYLRLFPGHTTQALAPAGSVESLSTLSDYRFVMKMRNEPLPMIVKWRQTEKRQKERTTKEGKKKI